MTSFEIPVLYEPFERQRKAARVLHLLASFLMIANAWGDFKQPTPNLVFISVQMGAAILILLFVFTGKKIFPNTGLTNSIFRLLGAAVLLYAAWMFYTVMNLTLLANLQLLAGLGLLFLFYSERFIFANAAVTISEAGVRHPWRNGHRLLRWSEVEDMRIRNDYISINTRSNQFLQFESAVVLSELQMDEMNAFCRERFVKTT
ncbi:MAG: hypothetical protein ACK4E8_00415 [Lacibacter sp.]|jgi:hypothetical protein